MQLSVRLKGIEKGSEIRDEMMGAFEREPERHGIKVLLAGASKLSKKDSVMSSNPVKPSSKPMS
jgi:hypothetical protein